MKEDTTPMSGAKKILFWAVVAAQLLVLVFMIVKQERLLAGGQKVLLKCVPVDPRSLFSGDYVILNYEITRLKGNIPCDFDRRSVKDESVVYVALSKAADEKYYSAQELSLDIAKLNKKYPVVMRGRIVHSWDREVMVRYGVEEYFVPQKEGLTIEKQMADVAVMVSVNDKGESAIARLYVDDNEVSFY